MFCSRCGTSNPDGAVFCRQCGNKMIAVQEYTPVQPTVNTVHNNDNLNRPIRRAVEPESTPKVKTTYTRAEINTKRLTFYGKSSPFVMLINLSIVWLIFAFISLFNGLGLFTFLEYRAQQLLSPWNLSQYFSPVGIYALYAEKLLVLIPIVLIIVGLIKIYFASKKSNGQNIKTGGAGLLKAGIIFNMAMTIAVVVVIAVGLVISIVKIACNTLPSYIDPSQYEYSYYLPTDIGVGIIVALVIAMVVLLAVGVFMALLFININKLITDSCYSNLDTKKRNRIANFIATISYTFGGLCVVAAIVEAILYFLNYELDDLWPAFANGHFVVIVIDCFFLFAIATLFIFLGRFAFAYKKDVPEVEEK